MLNFASPDDFINSLQKEVNQNFLHNRLPLNYRLNLVFKSGFGKIDQLYSWPEGIHQNYITIANQKKVIATFYSYHINGTTWFRYFIKPHSRFTPKPTILLQTAIREVLSEANLNGSETNIAQINSQLRIKQYETPTTIKAEWIYLPMAIGYFAILGFSGMSMFGPMMLFLLPIAFVLSVTYLGN